MSLFHKGLRPTDRSTNRPTNRLLELLRAAKYVQDGITHDKTQHQTTFHGHCGLKTEAA